MAVTQKQMFLSSLENHGENVHVESFVKFMETNYSTVSKNASYSAQLDETIESLSVQEMNLVWEKLRNVVTCTLMSLERNQDDPELMEQHITSVAEVLNHIVTLAMATLAVMATTTVPSTLLETGIILHGILLTLPDTISKFKTNLVSLFTSWWVRGLEGRREIIPNTLIYLLQQSLLPKATGADVKRVCAISDCLHIFNIQQLNNDRLQPLLLQCFSQKLYLKLSEGTKLLSLLLRLNVDFVDITHKTLLSQLPLAIQTNLKTYGVVYFKAWSESTGDTRQKIETTCIQDLIYRAVHAQRISSRGIFSALRTVLHHIHTQKVHKGVDEMIQRLYEPILWRSLKVANGHVRANAATLFMDIFPVQNPDSGVQDNDTLLQMQFDTIQTLLMDPYQEVRALTAAGVCKILKSYWEIIPSDVIVSLLSTLTNELVYDSGNADVRTAIIKGMSVILDQPLSHVVLKKVLPELHNFIHDKSEKVRLAMVDLLITVKSVRTIKFWSIVPLNHIFERLASDTPSVCRKIVRLIHPSLMPTGKPREVLLERCLAFLESNPAAVRPFFRYAETHMSLDDKVSYIVMLCRCILECVRSKKPHDEQNCMETEAMTEEEAVPSDDATTGTGLSMDNPAPISCLLDVVAILWATIETDLAKPTNSELKVGLQRKFAIALPEFLQAFELPEMHVSLITISGYMPPKLVPQLSRSCLSKLRDLDDSARTADYSILLDAVVKWGKAGELLEMVEEWIGSCFNSDDSTASTSNKTKKTVGFVETHKPRPLLGIAYLTALLSSTLSRPAILQFNSQHLQPIRNKLKNITDVIEKRFSSADSDPSSDKILVEAFTLHHKLEILNHKPGDETNNTCAVMESLFTWADTSLLPLLRKRENPSTSDDGNMDLAHQLVMVLLESGRASIMVGVADQEFAALLADFAYLCLKTDLSAVLLTQVSKVLHQLCEYTTVTTTLDDEGIGSQSDFISPLFDQLLKSLQKTVNDEKITEELIASGRKSLTGIIETTYGMTREISREIVVNVRSSLVATVIADLCLASQQENLEPTETYAINSLPIVSQVLLMIVSKKKYIALSTLDELSKCIECGALTSVHMVHAASHIIASLDKVCGRVATIDCVTLLQSRLVAMGTDLANHSEESPEWALFNELKTKLDQIAT